MNVLSLFDGISCGQVALERAKMPVENYYASEIDKYTISITQKHYPNTIQLGNIRNIKTFPKEIDLLIGGPPCQDLSIASHGNGLQGLQSALFYEFVRALKETKPKYFLMENVASMRKEDRDVISKHLECDPIMINSALVSAQQRKRYYWTNIRIEQPIDRKIYVKDIIDRSCKNYLKGLITLNCGYYHLPFKPERSVTVSTNSIENYDKPDRLYTIGGGGQGERVYSILGKSITISANSGGKGSHTGLYDIDGIRKLTPLECERLQTLPEGYTEGLSDNQRYKLLGNGWTVDVITHILSGI